MSFNGVLIAIFQRWNEFRIFIRFRTLIQALVQISAKLNFNGVLIAIFLLRQEFRILLDSEPKRICVSIDVMYMRQAAAEPYACRRLMAGGPVATRWRTAGEPLASRWQAARGSPASAYPWQMQATDLEHQRWKITP